MTLKEKIVIGTWPLSGDLGAVNKDLVSKTIEACFDCGFYEFDMAPNYGNGFCEKYFGSLNNKNITINTKFGNNIDGIKNFDVDSLKSSLYESLDRLNVENINSLFLHNPRNEISNYEPILFLFEELKRENIINKSGISLARNYDYGDVLKKFDSIQNDYNILYQNSLDGMYRTKNMLFYARSPLATGILSGKLNEQSKFDSDDYRSKWLKGNRLQSILKRVEILDKLTDFSLDSLARKFVLNNNLIDKVIIGVKSPKHVYDIQNDIEQDPLDNNIIKKINSLYFEDFGLVDQRSLSF